MNFTDSDKLIFCCYLPGARGFALRIMLQFSPESENDFHKFVVRHDGAAHAMTSRHGLRRHRDDKKYFNLLDVPTEIGLPDTTTFWRAEIDQELISHCRKVIDDLWLHRGVKVDKWRTFKNLTWVDHIPPHVARALFPNARIIYLQRSWLSCGRDYAMKNLFQHPSGDASKFGHDHEAGITTIDVELRSRGISSTRSNYRARIRASVQWQMDCSIMMQDTRFMSDAYVVDADRLFDINTYRKEYDGLIQYCRLTPNHRRVEIFLHDFMAKQFDRSSYVAKEWWS